MKAPLGLLSFIVAIAILCLFAGIFKGVGYRLNMTDSAPHGLWQVHAIDESLKRGQLVEVCPSVTPIVAVMKGKGYLSSGNCDQSEVIPLLKPISAVEGDQITLSRGHDVVVNHGVLPNTKAMPNLPAWPDGVYKVKAGEVWLFSTYSSGSFDSRYFGPVGLSHVRGIAVAKLVAGDPADMTKGVVPQ